MEGPIDVFEEMLNSVLKEGEDETFYFFASSAALTPDAPPPTTSTSVCISVTISFSWDSLNNLPLFCIRQKGERQLLFFSDYFLSPSLESWDNSGDHHNQSNKQ